jgi:hypothetical protein
MILYRRTDVFLLLSSYRRLIIVSVFLLLSSYRRLVVSILNLFDKYMSQSPSDKPSESTIRTLKSVMESMECMGFIDIEKEPEILNSDDKSYKIYICAYAINTGCFIESDVGDEEADGKLLSFQTPVENQYVPFVQWIVVKDGEDEYNFPTLDYICPQGDGAAADMRDECILEIMSKLLKPETDYHGTSSRGEFTDSFKGFVRPSDNESSIYVVFDLTLFQNDILPAMKWAIVDELMYKKTVLDSPVGKSVAEFMDQHECLLQTAEGQDMPFPFQVYMCKRDEDDSFVNVAADDSEREYVIEYEEYGPGVLFTSEPSFLKGGKTEKLRRYALFVSNCLYLLPGLQSGGGNNVDSETHNKDKDKDKEKPETSKDTDTERTETPNKDKDNSETSKGLTETPKGLTETSIAKGLTEVSKELTQLNPTVLPGDNTKPGSILKEAEKSLVSIGKSLKNLTGTSDKVQEQTQTSEEEGDASQTSELSTLNVYDNKEETSGEGAASQA